jgi:hypothetical protein
MLDIDYESPNQSTNDDFSGICIFFLPISAKRSQLKSLIGSRTMSPIIDQLNLGALSGCVISVLPIF